MTTTTVSLARQLAERECDHPVLSVYLDLDPVEFAIAPSRQSQVRSLLDDARRSVEAGGDLSHDDRLALREDIERIARYLRDPDVKGARSMAIFCSARDDLFEVVRVPGPAAARVEIGPRPYVEPLIAIPTERRWLVVLVNRRLARFLTGTGHRLTERGRVTHVVRGQHDQGGWSQANYQRSIEKDVMDSLRDVADLVQRVWRRERFDRVALGGPIELVPKLEPLLAAEVRQALVPERIEVDVEAAGKDDVVRAAAAIVEADERRRERDALDQLVAGLATATRAAAGPDATLGALGERRVQTLLLAPGFERSGGRCPECGLLQSAADGRCPADGARLEHVAHLREAVVEAAIAQDAEVVQVSHHPDLGPHEGVAALLRF